MNEQLLAKKGSSLLVAVAYGDAAGLPVETRSAAEIAARYGTIRTLLPTSEHELFHTSKDPGYWSDDTQQSVAVAEALLQADGFDLSVMAEKNLEAYTNTEEVLHKGRMIKRGYGGSTIKAMERLEAGVSPTETGEKDAAGNGILMKLAPLAFWQIARETNFTQRMTELDQLTTMTHDSDAARLTTRVHGDILGHLLRHGYDRPSFLEVLDASLSVHEHETNTAGLLRDGLAYLHGPLDTRTILTRTDAKGFYAPQTLAMAYGAFMAHEGDFKSAVYEAVNLGGDTDSTASIVAGMSALSTEPPLYIPIDHLNLDQLDMLKETSRKLAHQALR